MVLIVKAFLSPSNDQDWESRLFCLTSGMERLLLLLVNSNLSCSVFVRLMNFIALVSQQTILRKPRFQVNNQNDQRLEVVWLDWQSWLQSAERNAVFAFWSSEEILIVLIAKGTLWVPCTATSTSLSHSIRWITLIFGIAYCLSSSVVFSIMDNKQQNAVKRTGGQAIKVHSASILFGWKACRLPRFLDRVLLLEFRDWKSIGVRKSSTSPTCTHFKLVWNTGSIIL